MRNQRLPNRLFFTAAVLLMLPGCSGGGLGQLGEILGGAAGLPGQTPQQGQVRAEIQQVDTRQQQIQIRASDGQTGAVRYDQSTQVIYQQQQYPVTALERGDLVVMQLQQLQSGELYASQIAVEQSVQERTGQTGSPSGQVQQIEGRVGQVDQQRGQFQLQTQSSGTLVVALPYNPSPATEQRFYNLRQGDAVRIEGVYLGEGRVELYQFR